jgi:hypothetical protein
MSGTWAVRRAGDGPRMTAGFTEEEATRHAAELPGLLDDPDASFTVTDLLPELEQRFPEGGSVWLGKVVYWRRGQQGTVALGEPASYSRWAPRPGPVPWFIGTDGAEVFVALDDGHASWWPARWLDTREDLT